MFNLRLMAVIDKLTLRQQEVMDYIQTHQLDQGVTPTLREIARHFAFRSMTAAADHVRALRRKGFLAHQPRLARAHHVISPWQGLRRMVADIPLYGSIPAGYADECEQEALGCVSVDAESLGLRPRADLFALRVRGDSMIGRHILDGDVVIVERGFTARTGDVVAALIDNESTLKTLLVENGRPCLRAENPCYPKLYPAHELSIQGVMVGLIRKGQ